VVLSGAEQAISEGSGDLVIKSRVPPGFLSDWLLDVEFIAVARADHPLLRLGRELSTDDLAHQYKPWCGIRAPRIPAMRDGSGRSDDSP
jgi:DNA-binding transcriptional LysR family regulator